MNWLAILLSLAALGGQPAPGARPTLKQCNQLTNAAVKKQCRKAAKAKSKKPSKTTPGAPKQPTTGKPDGPSTAPTQRSEPDSPGKGDDEPKATPTPGASPTPGPTATPTPGPVYPSRTGVDLVDGAEWTVRPSYRILAAGRIDFVTTNVGEDDHDLAVRRGTRVFGRIALAPGENDTLTLDLAAGAYTLFCPLEGHEEAGMHANISVR